jgi:hypothetical protein
MEESILMAFLIYVKNILRFSRATIKESDEKFRETFRPAHNPAQVDCHRRTYADNVRNCCVTLLQAERKAVVEN